MSGVTIKVLENHFPEVRASITGEGLLRAARAGGHVIEAEAKINVNDTFSSKSTGALAGSINVADDDKSETYASVVVGPTVIYGRIQELGGVIKPVNAKMLSWVDDGVRIFANLVHLPARPYLRPAVDENEDKIGDAIGYQIRRDIEGAL